MMRVYVDPVPATLSRAMWRISSALRRHAPPDITIVSHPDDAHVQLLHVINVDDAISYITRFRRQRRFVVGQWCYATGAADVSRWYDVWCMTSVVWSYFDLAAAIGASPYKQPAFLHTPLGIDPAFLGPVGVHAKRTHVMTTGYVNGVDAEAIAEVAIAAAENKKPVFHLGPIPTGMPPVPGFYAHADLRDVDVAAAYRRAVLVSGLRHGEGFELPVIEGMSLGARPIVFARDDMRQWYDRWAVFVPESSGTSLSDAVSRVLQVGVGPLSESEVIAVRQAFSWDRIATQFWATVRSA